MVSEKRKNARCEVLDSFFFTYEKATGRWPCYVKNISATGACIKTDEKIKSSEIIYLHIISARETVLRARVEWEIDSDYGIQFLLETGPDFENISFLMNNFSHRINKQS